MGWAPPTPTWLAESPLSLPTPCGAADLASRASPPPLPPLDAATLALLDAVPEHTEVASWSPGAAATDSPPALVPDVDAAADGHDFWTPEDDLRRPPPRRRPRGAGAGAASASPSLSGGRGGGLAQRLAHHKEINREAQRRYRRRRAEQAQALEARAAAAEARAAQLEATVARLEAAAAEAVPVSDEAAEIGRLRALNAHLAEANHFLLEQLMGTGAAVSAAPKPTAAHPSG